MKESIVLAAYHGPGVHQHYESLRDIKHLNIATINQCPIDAARSYLLQVAFDQTPCEVFVFIDSDVAFDPLSYEALVRSCLETRGVVAGCYISKALDGSQRLAGLLTQQDQELTFYAEGGRYPSRGVPMGFTAIHRAAVERLIESKQEEKCTFLQGTAQQLEAYPFFMPMVRGGIYYMEDYAFSLRALAAGVELYFDTRPRIRHYGPHGHRVTDLKIVSRDYEQASINFKVQGPIAPEAPEEALVAHYPPGMGEESRRLHREYNRLVARQRAGDKNGPDVIRVTDECAAKGILLVPGGENL